MSVIQNASYNFAEKFEIDFTVNSFFMEILNYIDLSLSA